MDGSSPLVQVAIFLAAAALAAPLAKFLRIGSILGYLGAGILIGPSVLNIFYPGQVEKIKHFSEFGVVLLLFLIGLELKPQRLWTMRSAIFGLGSAQVFLTGFLLAGAAMLAGYTVLSSLLIGFALSLSSTAFALQVLEEKGELSSRHGRSAFSILLFQDLFAIPLLAITPFLAVGGLAKGVELSSVGIAFGIIILVILTGHYVLDRMYRLIAATGVHEAMTASALLTVVAVAILMQWAGLSAALGAFIAGAMLADSPYRHQIQADIQPFEGLLLGVFFTAIGMSLDIKLLLDDPWMILSIVAVILIIKCAVLFVLGRLWGLQTSFARRLAIVLSQGGEFAFVIFAAAGINGVIAKDTTQLLNLAVTLSMMATPFLLLFDDLLFGKATTRSDSRFDIPPEEKGHVIIAGFGRFGQIVARVLQAKHIPFTALDISSDQVDFVKRFGNKIYYGDASRLAVLQAAQIEKASALVIAIDDVEATIRMVETIKQNYPQLPLYVRARNRQHVFRLLDLGVKHIKRETFLSALDMTKDVLIGLGESPSVAEREIAIFREFDRALLYENYKMASDTEKLAARAKSAAKQLEELFEKDVQENVIEEHKVEIAQKKKSSEKIKAESKSEDKKADKKEIKTSILTS